VIISGRANWKNGHFSFRHYIGGYANTFQPIPEDWRLEGDKQTDGALDLRTDLDPESYADYVGRWLQQGANVVGGCCGTRPTHISKINELFFFS